MIIELGGFYKVNFLYYLQVFNLFLIWSFHNKLSASTAKGFNNLANFSVSNTYTKPVSL